MSIAALGSERFVLGLPIDCAVESDCYIQSYVDMQSGDGARDHRCGSATYDGHKGVDFRVLSAKASQAGVDVVAAAAGVVKGRRDGMPDAFISADGRRAVAGRECGNGVVIDHGGGWETQYCHLRRGSVVVRSGERVARGQKLGLVGFSGAAQFAHVHLSVRRDGEVVDPFTGRTPSADPACDTQVDEAKDGLRADSLWAQDVATKLAFSSGQLIDVGFAGSKVSLPQLEGQRNFSPARADAGALVFFGRAINLRAGDRLAIKVTGPAGFEVENPGKPMPRSKAQWFGLAGKRLRAARWPAGAYVGEALVVRDNRVVSKRVETLRLD